jgi:phospholipid/cholesterol/gamma-HCH transport system permease protein
LAGLLISSSPANRDTVMLGDDLTTTHPNQVPASVLERVGRRVVRFAALTRELSAFALISLGAMVARGDSPRRVMRPRIREEIYDAGVRLLPIVTFLGTALGLLVIAQTTALLSQLGAQSYVGTIMVTVVVREIGPLITAILVLARAGTANVVELGTLRALGEVRALESLGIDPIHYLVMPRMLGLSIAVFTLTVYLILTALVSGYLFAFLQGVALRPGAYVDLLGDALLWQDFVLLALKTLAFGAVIAVVNCYQGLARPLDIDDVAEVTARAVVQSITACVLLDAVFLVGYVFA